MSDTQEKPREFWLNFELHEPEVWDEPHKLRYPLVSTPDEIVHVVEYSALEKERFKVQKLREALEKHGSHKFDCRFLGPHHECSCGFNEALAQTKDNT